MHATLSRFVRLAAGYSLVTLVGPVFTVLLTPLYTRVLAPADYGVVESAIAVSAFVNTLVLFALDQALGAHFHSGDQTHQRDLVTTALWIVLVLGLAASAVLNLAAEPLALYLYKDPGRQWLLRLVALGAVTTPLYGLILAALRLQMRVRRANALALGLLLATVASNVVLILGLGLKATGVIAANMFASLCACGLGLALAHPVLRGRFDRRQAGVLLRTAATLLPGGYSLLILSGADRLLLTQFVSPTDLGLYSIANKLAAILYVVLSAAWYAWWPMALEMARRPEAPAQFARMLEYLGALALLTGVALGAFAPEILSLFTRSVYVPAAPLALVLMLYTGPLNFSTQQFFIGLYIQKRTLWISAAYFAAAVTNVVLNLMWDPQWGVWGAVWATVAAGLLLAGLAYIAGQRVFPVPYRLGRLLLLGLLYGAAVALFLLVPAANHVAVKLAVLAALAGACVSLGIVTPRQLALAWHAVQRWLAGRLAAVRSKEPT